jgi:hypothetical protein
MAVELRPMREDEFEDWLPRVATATPTAWSSTRA